MGVFRRKEWKATKYSILCEDHFDPLYIKPGKTRNKLIESLPVPVPTIHTTGEDVPHSVLHVPSIPRPPPTQRNIVPDEKPAFEQNDKIRSLQCISSKNSPSGFSFEKHRDNVGFSNLRFDYVTSGPVVFESIVIDKDLHVTLSYHGHSMANSMVMVLQRKPCPPAGMVWKKSF